MPTPPACAALDPQRGVLYESARATRDRAVLIATWEQLTRGRYTLVPYPRPSGGRVYLLYENLPSVRARRALTSLEVAAAMAAAKATSGKATGYLLGIAPSTVSMTLSSAATKLGLDSRAELARLVRVLTVDASTVDDAALSDAERDVLRMLLEGKSNRAIALTRGRSERTVANQVASILRKTGCGSRRALRVLGSRHAEAMTIDEPTLASYRTHQKEGP